MAKPDCFSQILTLMLAGWMSLNNTLDCSELLFPRLQSGDVDNNTPHGTVERLELVIYTEQLEFARYGSLPGVVATVTSQFYQLPGLQHITHEF